jgi:hypothetical protein
LLTIARGRLQQTHNPHDGLLMVYLIEAELPTLTSYNHSIASTGEASFYPQKRSHMSVPEEAHESSGSSLAREHLDQGSTTKVSKCVA